MAGSVGSTGTMGSSSGGAGGGTTSPASAGGGATSPVSAGGTPLKLDAGRPLDVARLDVLAVITCPSLVPPLHGDLNVTSSNVGGVAKYTCSEGYRRPEPESRECQVDGQWSGTNPICRPIDCGTPPKPDNGRVDVEKTTFQSKATYSCGPNYRLDGDMERSCLAEGTWSGSLPTCQCVQKKCDGVCVDLTTDNDHCGECNKRCSAVSPSKAQCTPTGCLVTLATGFSLEDVVADSQNVYWSDSHNGQVGSVNKVPLGGGPTTTLASEQRHPRHLALDTSNLYFASDQEAIKKVPIAGGPVTTLATGENVPCCLVVNGADLYYYSGRGVVRLPLAGGSATPLPGTKGTGYGFALDSVSVYWREDILNTLNSRIMKMPLDGSGTPTTLVSDLSVGIMVVKADTVFWTVPAANVAAGALAKMPASGGTPTTLVSGLSDPRDLFVDGTFAYFTHSGEGTVVKIPVTGGTPTILASQQRSPSSIFVDGTSVYWANYGALTDASGSVMRLTPK